MPLTNGQSSDMNITTDHDKYQLLTLLNLPPPQPQQIAQTDSHENKHVDESTIKKEDDEPNQQLISSNKPPESLSEQEESVKMTESEQDHKEDLKQDEGDDGPTADPHSEQADKTDV